MPKKTRIDFEKLGGALRRLLMKGPLSAPDICRYLGVSQSTSSRIIARSPDDIFSVGRARKTLYALKRTISEVGLQIAVYQIDEAGKTSKMGDLQALHPRGFYFNAFFDDLPYFMDDLRPNGFLGRLIPSMHPDLNLPKNIADWSANECLKYLTRYGCDLIGNLIIGDDAFGRYLDQKNAGPQVMQRSRRDHDYPKRAVEVMRYGDPGSSAGGEQPKFSAVLGPDMTPVLVKFSPRVESAVSQRQADLLVCESISLGILNQYGQSAATSTLILGDDRVFLESERFDRVGSLGRKGIISLAALDNEFVGKRGSWTATAGELLEQRRIDRDALNAVRWRELFGHLIGNTDMHLANISFFFQLPEIRGIAPAYDMLPMRYAPQNGQIVDRDFNPPLPKPIDVDIWKEVWTAGKDFWATVSTHDVISPDFRKIAQSNLEKLQSQEHIQKLFS